ncbi:Prephenate dehydratase-domain-containing protein [Powellomyces hirtus]|nr:Prephenate dehydratase-domain-containing protein [Powellomyces hirtus]
MGEETTPSDLGHLRSRIDTLDADLVRLLNERASVSVNIGLAKQKAAKTGKAADDHIHRPSREKQIYDRLETLNHGPLPTPAIQAIFREVMSASISLQRETTIAFLGPRGTYTHQVAFNRFGDSVQYVAQDTIEDVFDAVESGSVTYGVVPFENSRFGSVQATLDRFCTSSGGVQIRAEAYLPVQHSLLVNKGTSQSQIRRVYSHQQGFGQCQSYISQHLRGVERINVSSTAHAADLASREPGSAAICSPACAALYGLDVVATGIEDAKDNTTRFFIIGNTSDSPSADDRTLLSFTVDHRQPGALADALSVLKTHNINLTKIDSRPSGQRPWHFFFFIEMTGHMHNENVASAIDDMKAYCLDMRILGSYPSQRPPAEAGAII